MILFLFSVTGNAKAIKDKCQRLQTDLHKKPHSNIYNTDKNTYHQQRGVPGKTYIDQAYSLDLICNKGLRAPHLGLLKYNAQGRIIKTLIEIKFNVNVSYLNQADPLPSGSIVRLEFVPADLYRESLCEGKPQVLERAVVERQFTLHNGQAGTFHDFCRQEVDHTKCFYTPIRKQARRLIDHRPNLLTFTNCPLPRCYCHNLASTQQGGVGDLPPTQETLELQARGETQDLFPHKGESGDLLSKKEIKDNPPNWENRDFSPQHGQQGDLLPIKDNPPNQDNWDFPPPQHGQQGDLLPIKDNPPNPDNAGLPPPTWATGGPPPHQGQSTQSGQHGQQGDSRTIPPNIPPQHGQQGDLLPMEDLKAQTVDVVVNKGQVVTISQNKRSILDLCTEKNENKKIVECKRSLIGDGKSTVIQKVHRDAYISDLTWPMFKINEIEYSKRFNVQILEAMNMFHQGMARLSA